MLYAELAWTLTAANAQHRTGSKNLYPERNVTFLSMGLNRPSELAESLYMQNVSLLARHSKATIFPSNALAETSSLWVLQWVTVGSWLSVSSLSNTTASTHTSLPGMV